MAYQGIPQYIPPQPQSQINPYMQYPFQRLMQQEIQMSPNFLKGRPVTSIEEAKVAQIDFDGALNIFTDIANKKIYTKQINMDGTSSFNIYSRIEQEPEVKTEVVSQNELKKYVTREEFDKMSQQFINTINLLEQKLNAETMAKVSQTDVSAKRVNSNF